VLKASKQDLGQEHYFITLVTFNQVFVNCDRSTHRTGGRVSYAKILDPKQLEEVGFGRAAFFGDSLVGRSFDFIVSNAGFLFYLCPMRFRWNTSLVRSVLFSS
jgi:hypothetical protein